MNELERLKELRFRLNLSTVCSEQGLTISEKYDLMAVIDSEISRQQKWDDGTCKSCHGTGIGNPYDTNCLDCGGTGIQHSTEHSTDSTNIPQGDYDGAIEWQKSLKQHHQREWEKTDVDWKMEPGARETHEAMMASFDMAIQALQKAGE